MRASIQTCCPALAFWSDNSPLKRPTSSHKHPFLKDTSKNVRNTDNISIIYALEAGVCCSLECLQSVANQLICSVMSEWPSMRGAQRFFQDSLRWLHPQYTDYTLKKMIQEYGFYWPFLKWDTLRVPRMVMNFSSSVPVFSSPALKSSCWSQGGWVSFSFPQTNVEIFMYSEGESIS